MSHSITSPKNSTSVRPIKIKSPRSEIKLHKLNVTTKTTPEIVVRGSASLHSPVDNADKINQAWNRLKINALSKAITMAPQIGQCTIGPKSLSEDEPNYKAEENEKLDLSNAVTSTPLKPKKLMEVKVNKFVPAVSGKTISSCDISEISLDSNTLSDSDINVLEMLKVECLNNIEAQVRKCGETKMENQMKKWLENQEKLKEKLMAQKIEMDRERLIRVQSYYIESKKLIKESKENAQRVKAQQLEQSKSDHDKRIAETSERLKQIEQKRKELEEKQKLKREELKRCIEGIYMVQLSYNKKYNQISDITKKCKNGQMLYEKVAKDYQRLKEMGNLLLRLVEKCGEGKVSFQDLKIAENLNQQIIVICDTFSRHVELINSSLDKAEEDKKKEEAEKELRVKQQEADKQLEVEKQQEADKQQIRKEEIEREKSKVVTDNKSPAPTKLYSIEDCVSKEYLKWHIELKQYLLEYEKKLQPLVMNDSLKNFRLDCQKVVNVPVNAISPTDDLHLEDKWYKLSRMLRGLAVPLGDSLFLVTGHPLGLPYCTNLLAKKFVKQGEQTVSSKPEAAFAFAAVIVSLWAEFPEFGRLLLGHFHRECPYLIPAFFPQTEGQTDQEYYKLLGYKYLADGKIESQHKFLSRMAGIMHLYAAVLVTPLKRSLVQAGRTRPHDMREAWRWLAATLNLSPRVDISPTLIFNFLEVTGHLFYRTYGVQFTKLLHVLCADYFPLLEKVTTEGCGPVIRLKNFLEKVLKEGEIPPPAGLLPPNFW